MYEIKIYGYISNVAEQKEKEVSLIDLQDQLKSANGEDILCRINSNGGDVEEGFAMYYELRRYAKDNNAKVKTFAESRLGSIATVVFLAGDERELTTDLQPFVHEAFIDRKEPPNESEQLVLDGINKRIASHYALHTDLTEDEALELMVNETRIPTELSKEMRFATSIEHVFRPVALKRFNININDNKMNKRTQSILNKAAKALGMIYNKVVSTADGSELDFYELQDADVIAVGAMAYYDGVDADGSFLMPTGETYVFVAGELTEIQPAQTDNTTNENTLSEANATIALLSEQLEALSNKVMELSVQNRSKDALISSYKVSSKPIVDLGKEAPKEVTKKEVVSNASKAILNINKNLKK